MTYQDKVVLGDCTLYLGDSLEVMKEMPDKSIDLICTDPPYNIGKAEWDKINNYIIKHSSNDGDLVLDLFMGYGSCGEACVKMNRKFIGIDNDKSCVDYSIRRINDAQQQMRLPL